MALTSAAEHAPVYSRSFYDLIDIFISLTPYLDLILCEHRRKPEGGGVDTTPFMRCAPRLNQYSGL